MNHDAPVTPAAMQAHIAELEQQLKLSDEGVSQLAQRCLELEQQLLTCQTELSRHSAEAENITLTLPQLFYDTGSGFSPRECLVATEDVYNELTHEVSVTFILPEDARAVRLDPGELACCITDLAISDERISFQPVNGLVLQEDSLLFLDVDPNLSLHCTTGFGAGMKFAVNYHYYPLGRFLHEQPGKSLLRALNDLKLKNATAAQEADEVLQASRAECMRLNQQLLTLQGIQHEYQVSLENMRASSSWRLTAPLRRLLTLLRGHCARPVFCPEELDHVHQLQYPAAQAIVQAGLYRYPEHLSSGLRAGASQGAGNGAAKPAAPQVPSGDTAGG